MLLFYCLTLGSIVRPKTVLTFPSYTLLLPLPADSSFSGHDLLQTVKPEDIFQVFVLQQRQKASAVQLFTSLRIKLSPLGNKINQLIFSVIFICFIIIKVLINYSSIQPPFFCARTVR